MKLDAFLPSKRTTFFALVLTPSIIVDVQNTHLSCPALKYLITELAMCFCSEPSWNAIPYVNSDERLQLGEIFLLIHSTRGGIRSGETLPSCKCSKYFFANRRALAGDEQYINVCESLSEYKSLKSTGNFYSSCFRSLNE